MSYPAPLQLSRDGTSEKARIVINSGGKNGNVAFEGEASSGIDFISNLGDPTRSTTGVQDRKVRFDTTSFSSHDQTYVITAESATHEIRWEVDDGIKLSKATWIAKWNDGNATKILEAGPRQENMGGDTAMTGSAMATQTPTSPRNARRQETIQMLLSNDNLILPINAQNMAHYNDSSMYIQLQWASEGESGTTTSGAFTVFTGTWPPVAGDPSYGNTVGRIEKQRKINDTEALGTEVEGNPTTTLPTATTQPTTASTASLNPNASQTSIGSGSSRGGGSTGGGSGGLAPGAIAGIVIGSVLGLALIAFLIWFFLRRRRNRADHVSDGAYGTGHNPHQYLTDKETHARVTESPHSPYTDDGQHQHSQHHLHQQQSQPQEQHHLSRELHQDDHNDAFETTPTAAATAAAAAAPASAVSATDHHQPPFAPYREENMSTASRSVEDMTRSGAGGPRSSTPNVNSNVSHLIEDGMTEDEIRRLEEEEMALDAAIEQAGPRRKP